MAYQRNQKTPSLFGFTLPIQIPPELQPRMEELYGNGFTASGGDVCIADPFGLNSPRPEGSLSSASDEHASYLESAESSWRPPSQLDPTNDEDMGVLMAIEGDTTYPGYLGTDERLEFLANNDRTPELVPDRHAELMRTDIPKEARESLEALGQNVHDPYNLGVGGYNIDEYSVILDELPEGVTPEEFVDQFLLGPNQAVDDDRFLGFDFFNIFEPKAAGEDEAFEPNDEKAAPGVGDWFHIDIPGTMSGAVPGNNGDVMIVDRQDDEQRSSATVQTMTDDEFGPFQDHPVSGRRQFGVEPMEDGGYRFYTRGFDRPTNALMDNDATREMQHQDWSAMMEAVATKHGGRSEQVDEDGDPVWGWHETFSGEELLESKVETPFAMPCDMGAMFPDWGLPEADEDLGPVFDADTDLGPVYNTPEPLGPFLPEGT